MVPLLLLFGGGGAEGPINNALIAALALFCGAALAGSWFGRRAQLDRFSFPILALALTLVAIPIAQLIPLPPSLWHDLPGRDTARDALALIGRADAWRSLSLDPEATLRSLAFLALPTVSFLYAGMSSRGARLNILHALVAGAAISGLIGAGQLALGHPDWLSFYDGATRGSASGIFANTNHQGLFMAVALIACGLFIREAKDAGRRASSSLANALGWLGLIFFAVMALASGSRAAVMLVALAMPCALILATASASASRKAIILIMVSIILIAIILAYPGTNSLGARESFRIAEDARYAYLPDILFTLREYWPAGSGLGSFAGVFVIHEDLDVAARAYLNHAHNDLLEWLVETGVVGAVWLVIAGLVLIRCGIRKLRGGGEDQPLVLCSLFIVLLVGLHSLVDYPLRTASIAAIFAFAAGIVIGPGGREQAGPGPHRRWIMAALLVATLPLAVLTLQLGVSSAAARAGNVPLALQVGTRNPRALIDASRAALARGRHGDAEAFAIRAIERQPLSAGGLSALAASREAQGGSAAALWVAASERGWRDRLTQTWALRQALITNDVASAVLRLDALMRTGARSPQLLSAARLLSTEPRFASSLSARLALSPLWRAAYFDLPADAPAAEAEGLSMTFRHMLAQGVTPARSEVRSSIAYQLTAKNWARAVQLERIARGARSPDYRFNDGGFDRSADDYLKESTAFDWQLLSGRHSAASIDSAPPRRLIVDNGGERAELAAQRYLALSPGRYRLSFTASADVSEAFRIRITCPVDGADLVSLIVEDRDTVTQGAGFAVSQTCPVQRFMVEGLATERRSTLALDNVSIGAQ